MIDKIYYNGEIHTLDSEKRIVQAIGIQNGQICFLGTNEEALCKEATERIDLEQRVMLPGFVDGHMHMLNYAFVEKSVKLFSCKSVRDILHEVKERLKKEQCSWIYARGFNEDNFLEEKRYPTKDELNEISREIPIIVVRVCGHIAVVNDKGLEKLRQLKEFSSIQEEINFETGLIKEDAVQFFYSALDKPSKDQVKDFIRFAMKKLNEKGITGIQSDDFSSLPGKDWNLIYQSFLSLAENNEMTVRVYEQCLFEHLKDFKEFLELGHGHNEGNEFFTIGTLKILADGSLGAKTAAMLQPYEGDENNYGILSFTKEELEEMVELAIENDLPIAAHAIGDRGIEIMTDIIGEKQKKYGKFHLRNGIVHAQITNRRILEKMKEHHLIAYIQPVFVGYDMSIVENRIGKHRMKDIYAWKTMQDMGIPTVGGSDAPVESFDIMENIFHAVTRKNMKNEPENGWIPEEKLTLEDAVLLFTKKPAYSSFTEEKNGTLEIGKRADLVVLKENPYRVESNALKNIQVHRTIVGGKEVFTAR